MYSCCTWTLGTYSKCFSFHLCCTVWALSVTFYLITQLSFDYNSVSYERILFTKHKLDCICRRTYVKYIQVHSHIRKTHSHKVTLRQCFLSCSDKINFVVKGKIRIQNMTPIWQQVSNNVFFFLNKSGLCIHSGVTFLSNKQ